MRKVVRQGGAAAMSSSDAVRARTVRRDMGRTSVGAGAVRPHDTRVGGGLHLFFATDGNSLEDIKDGRAGQAGADRAADRDGRGRGGRRTRRGRSAGGEGKASRAAGRAAPGGVKGASDLNRV